MLKDTGSLRDIQFTGQGGAISRKMVIAILLGVALIAFEKMCIRDRIKVVQTKAREAGASDAVVSELEVGRGS